MAFQVVRQMSKDTKLVHFTITNGTTDEIKALSIALKNIKDNINFDMEFLVTNQRVELHDVKYLIKELYKLYKDTKK